MISNVTIYKMVNREQIYYYYRLLLDVAFCDEVRIYRDFAAYGIPITRMQLEALSSAQLQITHEKLRAYVISRCIEKKRKKELEAFKKICMG